MHSSQWISLLKKLPPEVQNQISVVTLGGTEIVVQSIMQFEGEVLMFKGRLAASQDMGRLFFLPYDQIDYIGFTRTVSEEEFRSWYGETAHANGISAAETIVEMANGNGSSRTPTPNRAALLERIRARTSSQGI